MEIEKLFQEFNRRLGETPDSKQFLKMVKSTKPRYIRDQFMSIIKTIQNESQDNINKALSFVVKRKLWSATTLV